MLYVCFQYLNKCRFYLHCSWRGWAGLSLQRGWAGALNAGRLSRALTAERVRWALIAMCDKYCDKLIQTSRSILSDRFDHICAVKVFMCPKKSFGHLNLEQVVSGSKTLYCIVHLVIHLFFVTWFPLHLVQVKISSLIVVLLLQVSSLQKYLGFWLMAAIPLDSRKLFLYLLSI